MSNKGSAAKRHRQNIKRRTRNKTVKSRVRSSTRKYLEVVESQSQDDAKKQYDSVASLLDQAVSKGVMHKNTAARKKNRLHKARAARAGAGKSS